MTISSHGKNRASMPCHAAPFFRGSGYFGCARKNFFEKVSSMGTVKNGGVLGGVRAGFPRQRHRTVQGTCAAGGAPKALGGRVALSKVPPPSLIARVCWREASRYGIIWGRTPVTSPNRRCVPTRNRGATTGRGNTRWLGVFLRHVKKQNKKGNRK